MDVWSEDTPVVGQSEASETVGKKGRGGKIAAVVGLVVVIVLALGGAWWWQADKAQKATQAAEHAWASQVRANEQAQSKLEDSLTKASQAVSAAEGKDFDATKRTELDKATVDAAKLVEDAKKTRGVKVDKTDAQALKAQTSKLSASTTGLTKASGKVAAAVEAFSATVKDKPVETAPAESAPATSGGTGATSNKSGVTGQKRSGTSANGSAKRSTRTNNGGGAAPAPAPQSNTNSGSGGSTTWHEANPDGSYKIPTDGKTHHYCFRGDTEGNSWPIPCD
ncbi:hypothetical protein H8R18_00820 [Nanchangia anserum]|uniref:hypothetical protein n=1 Tax=Nanchangia anserum TaxID=2692125 RepID=UPI001883EAD8|nr:hypothetical protein [Nanchangia anserum]QOX81958.1 hypothetical protein H8R18_00820 [Nanchangia anserum]